MIAGEKRMSWDEIAEEVQWQLDADVHPLLVPGTVGKTMAALEKGLRTNGHAELAKTFLSYVAEKRVHRARTPEQKARKNEMARRRRHEAAPTTTSSGRLEA